MRSIDKGMWVNYQGKIGIAQVGEYRQPDGSVSRIEEVHLVNDKGETTTVVPVAFSKLTQARFKDIPKSRLGGITAERAKKLWGYS